MKDIKVTTVFIIAAFSFAACNNSNKSTSVNSETDTAKSSITIKTRTTTSPSPDMKDLVANYLKLKNALVTDNSNDAAKAGNALANGFVNFDKSGLTGTQKKSFEDIADDAHEMAEHIGKSAGNIPHQREHFDMLSKDIYDLVKLLGAGQTLFVDRCPMYNDKKGAIWLSESKTIKNPYMGSAMATCGTTKEELK